MLKSAFNLVALVLPNDVSHKLIKKNSNKKNYCFSWNGKTDNQVKVIVCKLSDLCMIPLTLWMVRTES